VGHPLHGRVPVNDIFLFFFCFDSIDLTETALFPLESLFFVFVFVLIDDEDAADETATWQI
jgi:hypothetical protein